MSRDNATLKCYMGDTGLLVAQSFADRATTPGEAYRDILLDKLAVNGGMLVENAVAQQLRASGHALFFFSRSSADKEKRMEIDFLVSREYDEAAGRLRVSPIEVKSGGGRYATSSLDKFQRTFGKRVGMSYVLHPKPLRVEGGVPASLHGASAVVNCADPSIGMASAIDLRDLWPAREQ